MTPMSPRTNGRMMAVANVPEARPANVIRQQANDAVAVSDDLADVLRQIDHGTLDWRVVEERTQRNSLERVGHAIGVVSQDDAVDGAETKGARKSVGGPALATYDERCRELAQAPADRC